MILSYFFLKKIFISDLVFYILYYFFYKKSYIKKNCLLKNNNLK